VRAPFAAAIVTFVALLPLPAPRAQEAPAPAEVRWIAEEPAGIFPLEAEDAEIVVRGIIGNLELRHGEARELRWSSTAVQGGRPIPLAVGTQDRTVVLGLPPGDPARRTVSLIVPRGLVLRVETEGTQISGSALDLSLFVSGARLDVQLTSSPGAVELDLEGGKATLRAMTGAVTVRGRPEAVTVSDQQGPLTVAIVGGTLQANNVRGGTDLDLEGAIAVVNGALAPFRARANGAQLEVRELHGGGDLDLASTPLILEKTEGELTIRSDGAIQFKDLDSELRVHGMGASIRGVGNKRSVEVTTDSGEVLLGKIDGSLKVQGNSLTVRLEEILGATALVLSGSAAQVIGVQSPLTVECDLGDLVVRDAADKVQVKSRGGNVTLVGLRAPVEVEAEGDTVAVSFSSLSGREESVITNGSGEVRVELPLGGFLLEAKSHYGRVHTALPWVRLNDDGRSATGVHGRGQIPRIRIEADGDVTLTGPGRGVEPPGEVGPDEPEPEPEPETKSEGTEP
jgi:hypothetical protein